MDNNKEVWQPPSNPKHVIEVVHFLFSFALDELLYYLIQVLYEWMNEIKEK